VTEAADALHVAQSAVRRQIFNLVEELGVDLFIREGRTVRLTRIGKVFLEHMEKAMNVIDDARQEVIEYTDPKKGTIHIGFEVNLVSHILSTAIFYFLKLYQDVKFVLNQETLSELLDWMQKGEIKIALLGLLSLAQDKVKSTVLFTDD